MIVSDDDVSAALQYLSSDPHPIALAKKDLTDAENEKKEAFAAAFLESTEKSVEARKATSELDGYYLQSKIKESKAIMEYERHRARIRAAEMLLEIYRTENANARAAERIR